MGHNLGLDETASTLKLHRTTVNKLRKAGIIPYSYANGRYGYPKSFVEGLSEASNGIPITREFARLYLLAWQQENGIITSREAQAIVHRLREQGNVLINQEVAKLIGYGVSRVTAWRKQGWIRSVHIWRYQLSLRQDITQLKKLLDGLTRYEIASQLGVSLTTIYRRTQNNALKLRSSPNGSRAYSAEIEAISNAQTELTANTFSATTAARLLSVPQQAVTEWGNRGVLGIEVYGKRRRYAAEDVHALAQRFQTITPGFEWMNPISAKPRQDRQLWTRERTARYLSISSGELSQWSKLNLLPFYVRTPAGLASVRRDYVTTYIVGLKAYAGDRKVTIAVVRNYYSACLAQRLIA